MRRSRQPETTVLSSTKNQNAFYWNALMFLTLVFQLFAFSANGNTTNDLTFTDCSNTPSNIAGFVYLGEHNGSKYFCSDENKTWSQALALVQANGGHVAVINDAAENTFLKNNLLANEAWIGQTDAASEGNWNWYNGDNSSYTNWSVAAAEPNDTDPNASYNGADNAIIKKADGYWFDRNSANAYEVVMEIPCGNNNNGGNPATCAVRTISATTQCNGSGNLYGLFIKFDGLTRQYTIQNGTFTEFVDGTATITGLAVNNGDSNIKFNIDAQFTGRTTSTPVGSPKEHNCLNASYDDFYYYNDLVGTLTGAGSASGALINISDFGEKFQIGTGANPTHNALELGAAGWLNIDVAQQPTGSLNLTVDGGSNGNDGDFNLVLSGDAAACIDNGGSNPTCTPQQLVKYNMNACESFGNTPSPFDYSEFTPSYPNSGNCSNVSATGVFRNTTTVPHSCIEGFDGTGAAACFGIGGLTSFEDDSDLAIRFEVTLNPSQTGKLTGLKFREWAPDHFSHLSGNTGTNNYPTKYGIRVTKGGQEIFKQIDINTTQEWSLESFDFSNLAEFMVTSTTTFKFELLAYDAVNNGGQISAWDLDQIIIEGACCDEAPETGSIGNFVFEDLNGNGVQDGNEPGIDGVTVMLLDGNGNMVGSAQTTSNGGQYLFTDLPAGDYKVKFTAPNGYEFTVANNGGNDLLDSDAVVMAGTSDAMSQIETLGVGDDNLTIDAGLYKPAKLGNYVFEDLNENGIQDLGESGIDGVTVELLDAAGNTLASTQTANGGLYEFDGLAPGSYLVKFPQATTTNSGLQADLTTPNQGTNDAADSDAVPSFGTTDALSQVVVLASGDYDDTIDAGYIPVCEVEAGAIALLDGSTETCICVDGIGDPLDVNISGTSVGSNSGWVITDADLNILGLPATPPFDLDGAGVGTCLIWYLRYETIEGLAVGENAADLDGCFDLSNPITVDRQAVDGGTVSLTNGNTTYTGTAGDIVINVQHTTTATELNYYYIITDENDNILAAVNSDDTNTLDLSGAPAGECHVYGYSFKGELDLTAGEPITSLTDGTCQELSDNFITVIRECGAEAGAIALLDGSTETCICVDGIGDPLDVVVDGTGVGSNSGWVITDDQLNILGLPANPPFDLDGAGVGTCLIWYVRYETLEGATVGANAADLEGCFDLSNPITVVRQAADGGSVSLTNGNTTYTGTAGNIVIDVQHTTTATDLSYYYIITDANDNILAAVNSDDTNTLDLSGAPAGECHVYGLSFKGEVTPVPGAPISSLEDEDCADLSDNFITVIREEPANASIGDKVFEDENGNGIQDAGEPGIDGVTVMLLDAAGNMVAGVPAQTTANGGAYDFTNLPAGTYQVKFTAPTQNGETAILTDDNQGTDDAIDSDAIGMAGSNDATSPLVTVGANDDVNDVDAGYYFPASLGNYVFEDANLDGIQDFGENGIEGVPVELRDAAGNTLDNTTTDANGLYEFAGLAPGDYKVVFPTQANVAGQDIILPLPNAGTNDAADSDAVPMAVVNEAMSQVVTLQSGDNDDSIDAGYFGAASLGDKAFIDENQDGLQDNGDNPLPGVTVTLTGTDVFGNTVSATQITDQNGEYLFTMLVPGTYEVEFAQPVSYVVTQRDANGNGFDAADSDIDPLTGKSGQITLGSGDDNRTIDAGFFLDPVLPVALTSFEAQLVNNSEVALKWATASEEDNKHFIVERSLDGRDFEAIGVVAGNGTTNQVNTYSLVDEDPAYGYNYYRLKQVDFDGDFEYSPIETVIISGHDVPDVILYPNPVVKTTTLRVVTPFETDANIEIVDNTGKTLMNVVMTQGANSKQLDLSNFAPGMYFAYVNYNGHRELVHKIIKVEE